MIDNLGTTAGAHSTHAPHGDRMRQRHAEGRHRDGNNILRAAVVKRGAKFPGDDTEGERFRHRRKVSITIEGMSENPVQDDSGVGISRRSFLGAVGAAALVAAAARGATPSGSAQGAPAEAETSATSTLLAQ